MIVFFFFLCIYNDGAQVIDISLYGSHVEFTKSFPLLLVKQGEKDSNPWEVRELLHVDNLITLCRTDLKCIKCNILGK